MSTRYFAWPISIRGYTDKWLIYETRYICTRQSKQAMLPLKKHQKAAKKTWKKKKSERSKMKSTNQPKKLKQWDDENIRLAVEAVQSGQMSQNAAAH